jgi:hypothetical protein
VKSLLSLSVCGLFSGGKREIFTTGLGPFFSYKNLYYNASGTQIFNFSPIYLIFNLHAMLGSSAIWFIPLLTYDFHFYRKDLVSFMYWRPILCTLYGAVDFLNVLKKYIMYL